MNIRMRMVLLHCSNLTFSFVLAEENFCTNQEDCLAAAKDQGYAAGGKGYDFDVRNLG